MQNLKEQWAKNNAQAQNTAPQDKEIVKDTIQKILLNNLQKEITVPKTYTTIQDLFTANEGDRLQTLADWFQSPQFNRSPSGSYTFDPESKSMLSTGERLARKQEAQLQAEQQKAIEAQKQQLDIAKGLNSEYNDLEIADKKLQQDAQQFAQNLAFERERLAEERRHNRAVEANQKGQNEIITADKKKLSENNETLAAIDDGIKLIKQNPNAYSWAKGKLGADIANRIDPKGVYTRSQIDNITAVYRKWLTGAQMSDKERKDYERFLPAPTDNGKIVEEKLKGMKNSIEIKNNAILKQYGVQSKKDSLGIL